MNVEITKDAEKMLVILYNVFLDRQKSGMSKRDARRFTNDYFLQEKPFAFMCRSDVTDARMELANSNLMSIYMGGDCELTDIAIVYLGNRFKNGLIDVLSFLAQFIP